MPVKKIPPQAVWGLGTCGGAVGRQKGDLVDAAGFDSGVGLFGRRIAVNVAGGDLCSFLGAAGNFARDFAASFTRCRIALADAGKVGGGGAGGDKRVRHAERGRVCIFLRAKRQSQQNQ